MSNRTEVSITIDTEFSIAGAFDGTGRYRPVGAPAVECAVDGREQGLGFLLDIFEKYGIASTFFVECANYYYFGDEPMQGIARRIQAAGQDVQLHIHPVWLSFIKDSDIGVFEQQDSCAGLSFDELKRTFELCIAVFERWLGKRPAAIRTGGLMVDRNVYKVMENLNIPLASNVGLSLHMPPEEELRLYGGRHLIDGVMEVPTLSYRDMGKHIKTLQITSCSWREMKHILWKARGLGARNIVILTHPFEYIKKADFQYSKMTQNRVNQNRIKKLCQFIHEHDQDFVSADFGGSVDKWRRETTPDKAFSISPHYAIIRKIHNKINDSFWSY